MNGLVLNDLNTGGRLSIYFENGAAVIESTHLNYLNQLVTGRSNLDREAAQSVIDTLSAMLSALNGNEQPVGVTR